MSLEAQNIPSLPSSTGPDTDTEYNIHAILQEYPFIDNLRSIGRPASDQNRITLRVLSHQKKK